MKRLIFLLLGLGFIAACSSESSDEDAGANPENFNRTLLLTNWADNIIVPRYEFYNTKTTDLETVTATFLTTPNDINLELMRMAWLEAYKAYQYTALFNFGKAEEIRFTEISNTYPADVEGIELNIATGTYNLSLYSQYAKQGFPGIDYLINGLGTDNASIISFYTTNALASNYKKYLEAVVAKVSQNSTSILNDWNSGYREVYINNSGTSVTSAVNTTTNAFVKHFEKDIRTGKVGIPSGKLSNGTKFPEKVEAFYKNDISKTLLNNAITASRDFFNGKHYNSITTGASLKSFLEYVKAERDGTLLSTTINNQYETILNSTSVLEDSFSNQINSNNSKMIMSYDAMQRLVIYTKLDMMQALNISIDYVDGDGD